MSTASAAAPSPEAATPDPLKHFLDPSAVRPGNPFARRVAALRQALVEAISPADLAAIARVMRDKALTGDVAAAKFLATYTVGKPTPAPDPDRLDAEEWKIFKETAPIAKEMPQVALAPDPKEPLRQVRIARPLLAYALGQQIQEHWKKGPPPAKAPECQNVPNSDSPPSTNRDNGGLGEPFPPLDPEVWAALAELDLPPPEALG